MPHCGACENLVDLVRQAVIRTTEKKLGDQTVTQLFEFMGRAHGCCKESTTPISVAITLDRMVALWKACLIERDDVVEVANAIFELRDDLPDNLRAAAPPEKRGEARCAASFTLWAEASVHLLQQ